jgi:murein L,D-transpeptidase YcbB/YkuD
MFAIVPTAFAACTAAATIAAAGQRLPHPDSHPADSISLQLNLPAYRLDLRVADSVISYRVAIGARRYATPRGSFAVLQIELNPGWVPPESEWARDRIPMPPGPRNPMGRAKFEFLPTYYLHGTPEPESVGSSASHGCVRMRNEDALALGARLLAWGRPELHDSTLRAWIADSVTSRRVPLARGANLEIRYDLVEVRAGRVLIHPDPYRLRTDSTDALAQRLLVEALAPAPVPAGIAAQLLDRARSAGFTISSDSVSAGRFPARAVPAAD